MGHLLAMGSFLTSLLTVEPPRTFTVYNDTRLTVTVTYGNQTWAVATCSDWRRTADKQGDSITVQLGLQGFEEKTVVVLKEGEPLVMSNTPFAASHGVQCVVPA